VKSRRASRRGGFCALSGHSVNLFNVRNRQNLETANCSFAHETAFVSQFLYLFLCQDDTQFRDRGRHADAAEKSSMALMPSRAVRSWSVK
jgi:hypothetical protein